MATFYPDQSGTYGGAVTVSSKRMKMQYLDFLFEMKLNDFDF